jgi:NUMOD3 motif
MDECHPEGIHDQGAYELGNVRIITNDENKLAAMFGSKNHQFGKTGANSPNWGRYPSEETKKKMGASMTGKPKSEEHKQKMSASMTGSNNPNWGKRSKN